MSLLPRGNRAGFADRAPVNQIVWGLAACLIIVAAPDIAISQQVDCEKIVAAQAIRRQQREACLSALAKLDEKSESYVVELLSDRIEELGRTIARIEVYSQCYDRGSSGAKASLLDLPQENGKRSCSELTHLFIALSRKSTSLGRKDLSPFSRSSEEDKAELRATLDALGKVKALLDDKCSSALEKDPPSDGGTGTRKIRTR